MRWRSPPSATAARLTGLAALPTYSRGTSGSQYLYVNGRTVRDKLIFGALQALMPMCCRAGGSRSLW